MVDLGPTTQLQAEKARPISVLDPGRADVIARLMKAPYLALDIETDSYHAYLERVCLIQLATEEEDWLFDPLTHGLPNSLAQVLTRNTPTLVLHAGDNEVRAFKRDFSIQLVSIFDTAVAARVLGLPCAGLKDVLATCLSINIDKGEQRSDWSKRPLELNQLRYARQDVEWLIPLRHRLSTMLEKVGRLDWHIEECERVCSVEPTTKSFDEQSWRKVKAAKNLGRRGRAVMNTLWKWREQEAERKNIASFRVARPEHLAKIAKAADAHGQNLIKKIGGFHFLQSSVDRDSFYRAVKEGIEAPDPGSQRPQKVSSPGSKATPMRSEDRERLRRLKEGRQRWSVSLGLEPGFLLTNQQLERIARAAPHTIAELRSVEGLGRWRTDVLGQEIIDAVSQ
ncbi:MAG: HRDC domain-containing protein [Myxococcales bacterium]|nr:HRDC domain-containing protein [Myxococcales bacterium]